MRSSIRRLFRRALFVGAFGLICMLSSAGLGERAPAILETPGARADDPSHGFMAFIDAGRRTYLWAGTDASAVALYGRFAFYVEGVGTFMPAGLGTVEPKSDHSVLVRYDGPGWVDHAAMMDLTVARSISTGEPQATDVRLELQINPDHHTAGAQLWSGANTWKLVSNRPGSEPVQAATVIATLIKAKDWSAFYDQLSPTYQRIVSRAQWASDEAAALASWLGADVLSNVTVVSATQPIEDPGYWSAQITLRLTATGAGGNRTRDLKGVLIYEGNAWKFFTGVAP